ncbi:MAG TPA: hypothetical protein VG425_08370 [Casimicrobiaceae bacterium]|jgi:hypothetical protein|nr:hypothetical protein [Casimicrobiaceae bacterium]
MNMLSKQWFPDAIGACAGLAGLALLGVVAASGDAIGHSVVALIGGGFGFGVLGCVGKEFVAARAERRRTALSVTSQPSHALRSASIVKMPPLADATASEFNESAQASFAPIVSLTEAQVERQRERQPANRRATLNRA